MCIRDRREPACSAPTAREPVSRETPRTRPTEEYCEECGASRPCNDDIYFEKCEDHKVCHIGDTVMEGQGRILDLTMCLKNVCPGKRVAVGIALSELDPRGNEYPRGMKTFTVPEMCIRDRPARATALSRSPCTFCRTSM